MPDALKFKSQISWVYTDDLEGTCRFYGDVLGLPLEREARTARLYRCTGESFIGVCRAFEDRVVEPRGGMTTFVTDDVDGWYGRLLDAGADVSSRPQVLEQFGIYTFFVRDPNGYVIEFQRFLNA